MKYVPLATPSCISVINTYTYYYQQFISSINVCKIIRENICYDDPYMFELFYVLYVPKLYTKIISPQIL